MLENINSGATLLPTPETEVVLARWKGVGMGDYRCSWCDETVSGTPTTCPHCLAVMD